MAATSEVEDLCRRLHTFQQQLKVILDRNNEVLGHLEQVEAAVSTLDDSLINRGLITESLQICRTSSRQVQEIVEKQCGGLEEQIKELARHSDDDVHADLNRAADTTFSSVKQQLVSQLDYNMALQKDKAELEARLAEKLHELAQTSKTNHTLQEDVEESKEKMRSVLDRLDRTATDAEDRLDCLEKETKKAQKSSEEYQRLYETERQKVDQFEKDRREGALRRQASIPSFKDLTQMARKTRTSSTTPYLFQAPMTSVKSAGHMRPRDMDTKYLCLVDENKNLHVDVRRLRDENTHLMRGCKDSKRDVETIQRYIATCHSQRSELHIRLRREQEEHRRLVASMNKQASNWISEKKMVRGMETTSKAAKIQSESVFGAQRRMKLHSVKLSEDKPRDIPVQSW